MVATSKRKSDRTKVKSDRTKPKGSLNHQGRNLSWDESEQQTLDVGSPSAESNTKSSGGNQQSQAPCGDSSVGTLLNPGLQVGDRLWYLGESEVEVLEVDPAKGYKLKSCQSDKRPKTYWEKDLGYYTHSPRKDSPIVEVGVASVLGVVPTQGEDAKSSGGNPCVRVRLGKTSRVADLLETKGDMAKILIPGEQADGCWIATKFIDPLDEPEAWESQEIAEAAAARFRVGDRVIVFHGMPSQRCGVVVELATCNGYPNMPLVLGDDGIRRFEPPQLMKKIEPGEQLTLFPLEELNVVVEDEEVPCNTLTSAPAMESDSPWQQLSLVDFRSQDCANATPNASTSLPNDSPERPSITRYALSPLHRGNTASSPALPLASPSPSKASDSVLPTPEIASPMSSELWNKDSPTSLSWKTSLDSLVAPSSLVTNPAVTLDGYCGNFTSAGTMHNGKLSLLPGLELPGEVSDCCWLPRPGALSCNGNGRPPGLTKSEATAKQRGLIKNGQVFNPEWLEMQFGLPIGWTSPSESRAAVELLENAAPHWVTRLTPELPCSPCVESVTCPACGQLLLKLEEGCGVCGWFVTEPNSPNDIPTELSSPDATSTEPKRRRSASGWIDRYTKDKKLKNGTIATYPRVEGERNPDDVSHWYWAYKWEEKNPNARSDNGFISRAVSLKRTQVPAVQTAIGLKWTVEKILRYIRGEL